MEINGIEIKPGMVIEGVNDSGYSIILVVIPTKDGIAFSNISRGGWSRYYSSFIEYIEVIRDLPSINPIDTARITNGNILWEMPKTRVI